MIYGLCNNLIDYIVLSDMLAYLSADTVSNLALFYLIVLYLQGLYLLLEIRSMAFDMDCVSNT